MLNRIHGRVESGTGSQPLGEILKQHIVALDGIRGLAILAVVGYHAGLPLRYSGVVGVTLFFVLSGYLITRILDRELKEYGQIGLGKFYMRRFLRLGPAIIAAVALTSLFMVGTRDPQLGGNYWLQVVSTLTYTSDFFMASAADLQVLGHTWSLSIEEQFYLVWPVALMGVTALARSRKQAVLIVSGAAGIALVWRLVAPLVFSDWERTYYGPDTVFYALLAGCVLALLPDGVLNVPSWAGYAAVLSLAVLSAVPSISFNGIDRTITLYIGALAGLISVVAIAAAPKLDLLAIKPLVFFGTISYGWYIWHQIFFKVQPFGHRTDTLLEAIPLAGASAILAWASFRYFERPIQDKYRRLFQAGTTSLVSKSRKSGPRHQRV
ncbi:acyltransferase family protein [Arthrobacter nitrophenolicus]|uniref:Acyltransferase n=1 Tax=Arthrobacter nitrophenolicus TaxID=683150 RepID=A0A4R5YAW1_9MICC|nr:acyltransferase [Arthrobacter nitrophenolicus]TDL41117.1 acyltransferase [Arthrobacter nitrophenolicus]